MFFVYPKILSISFSLIRRVFTCFMRRQLVLFFLSFILSFLDVFLSFIFNLQDFFAYFFNWIFLLFIKQMQLRVCFLVYTFSCLSSNTFPLVVLYFYFLKYFISLALQYFLYWYVLYQNISNFNSCSCFP